MASNQPLTFTAQEINSTIKLTKKSSATAVSLEYSTDGGSTWSAFTVGTDYTLANIGDTFQLRATSTNASGMGSGPIAYHQFMMTGKLAASGNIMSLYDKDFATKSIAMTAYGFNGLFKSCTSLTTSPELPATTLATSCYYSMFNGCTALTTAPELPATTLAQSCYFGTFAGCTALTTMPELPATTMAASCYNGMFNGCTSLTEVPKLPATTLAASCYINMFKGCTSLNSVTAAISSEDLALETYTSSWLDNVASTGTFIYLDPDFDQRAITKGISTVPTGWTMNAPPNYFRLTAVGGSVKVKLTQVGGQTPATLTYRKNGTGAWSSFTSNTDYALASNEYIELKGTNTALGARGSKYNNFVFTAVDQGAIVKASGDITTMLNGEGGVLDLTGRSYCFLSLFNNCLILTDVENLELPSTTLVTSAYNQLFQGAGITKSPYLPAETLASNAYSYMFMGCANLTTIRAAAKANQLNSTNSNEWLWGAAQTGNYYPDDPEFALDDINRSVDTVPATWTIRIPQRGFWLGGKQVKTLFLNGKSVKTLFLNGKQVDFEGPEPPGPDPKETNFRITNIGNATDNPDDTWAVQFYLPRECEMEVYHSDSGNTETLTPGQITTLTLPYGEYLEFEGDNQNGLYPMDTPVHITCPEDGAYEASGQLSSLAKLDTKEVGYSFYGLLEDNTGLVKADNLVLPGGYDGLEETFSHLFYGCSNLVKGPENMPSANGANQFADMFNSCVKLESIGVEWTTWPTEQSFEPTLATLGWLSDAGTSAAKTPTFKCPSSLTIPDRDNDYVPLSWNITHA